MIAHPPCTYLALSGVCWLNEEKYGEKARARKEEQRQALDFVRALLNAPIEKICIENPLSVISTNIRPPNQIINPWWFGDSYHKPTCLWLKNLPLLIPTNQVGRGEFITWTAKKSGKVIRQPKWYADARWLKAEDRRTVRSKTFEGVAQTMAQQWGTDFTQGRLF